MATKELQELRASYRIRWDAHQIIADQNARLVQAGGQPSSVQLTTEKRAAEAVRLARDAVLAALAVR